METKNPGIAGRVVRFMIKRSGPPNPLEQWFIVGIDDDQKAMEAVSAGQDATDEIVEIIGYITPANSSKWKLRDGEVRLILPGEPVG